MLTFHCTITKPSEPSFDLVITVDNPTKADNGDYQCDIRLGEGRSFGIFGVSPVDAVSNALMLARTVVAGKAGNTVVWK